MLELGELLLDRHVVLRDWVAPPGGGADVLVRILTRHMAEDLGQVIVVQNQPGAGGAIAFGQVGTGVVIAPPAGADAPLLVSTKLMSLRPMPWFS